VIYKEDWEAAQERLTAWWDGEVMDRPVIQVTARRPVERKSPWDGWDFARYPDDPLKAVANFELGAESRFFGGEAFPSCWINLGAGAVAAFLGAQPVLYSDTVWFETPTEWEDLADIRMDPDNEWWVRAKRDTEVAAEKGEGRFFVGMTDLGGILDVAHSLRGKKRLMVDLFRNGKKVRALCQNVLDIWHRCYEELHAMIQERMKGSSAWLGIWCRDRWYPLQCDYAYMLSPAKFREFVLPDIAEQCRRLDYSVYHYDGYGQLIHLEDFLDIPELGAIQWTPGAGKPQCGSRAHYAMYRKVRAAGKGLVLGLRPEEIEPICREIGPEGMLFQTGCRTEEEARDLLKRSENWV
jgi:hypothetical protein